MAVMTPALMDTLVRTPPARPAAPRELLAVPGQPQALPNRPEQSPGRIPVAAAPIEPVDPARTLEDIEAQKEASIDYQILKGFVATQDESPEVERNEDTPKIDVPAQEPVTVEARPTPRPSETPPPEAATVDITRLESQRLEVTVADGRIEINVETLTYERIALKQPPPPVQKSDPLALDLNGDGLKTTGVDQGVAFDIDGDGSTDQTSFVAGGDAFLALDHNGNGQVDSGRELFGDQAGSDNGFLALSAYDSNQDRRIDANDAVYSSLRLLRIDRDGQQQLTSLAEAGVRAIDLNYTNTQQALNSYDSITQLASYERSDGSTGTAGDLVLGFREQT